MTEYRFQDNHPSTLEFHVDRERGPHTKQRQHDARFRTTLKFARRAVGLGACTLVDLGCGDGGFLDQAKALNIPCWGYDFSPANIEGSKEYDVDVEFRDVFNTLGVPHWGDITVVTEVLEHLADPHGAVEWIAENSTYIIASSPWGETPDAFDECHVWGWDVEGYRQLIEKHFTVLDHELAKWSQVILGRAA